MGGSETQISTHVAQLHSGSEQDRVRATAAICNLAVHDDNEVPLRQEAGLVLGLVRLLLKKEDAGRSTGSA